MAKPKSSEYIDQQRRNYSLYVLQSRAIPAITDGIKAAARRVLWTAKDGKKHKSASLAGATMPIHPHASPEGTINTLAAPYGNNIPLLKGDGAFGTLTKPTAYAASRYTSVSVSQFTKDVVFKDIEIIPMKENYDSSLMEPVHFLPLVPTVLLNPSEGIAVGFASSILPRDLESIIESQILCLKNKKFEEPMPFFVRTDSEAIDCIDDSKWIFEGKFKKINASHILVTKIPYGTTHTKFIDHLIKLLDNDEIIDYTDDSNKAGIKIEIKFKRGVIDNLSKPDMLKKLKLIVSISENMNVLSFDGQNILAANYEMVIHMFCQWRLQYYKIRYERLKGLLEVDVQKYKDILLAIKKNVSGVAKKTSSRKELKEYLDAIGIVNVDYIADLPIYRFTEEEKLKTEKKMKEANVQIKEYNELLKSELKRCKIYIDELKTILNNYHKGSYDE